ncbi:MAG: beta-galactosidase [Candidatus Omnitrophica bacterium]|nr:beta-galactosidase [Candidatus Omnitrophota bacterium]MCM8801939.1 beta-galactosidase [Candidatus Omnitrophota bacterium]
MKKIISIFLFSINFLFSQVPWFQTDYFKPKTELISPHIKFLNPYKNGKIDILWITYRRDGGFREIVELSQRMDINFEVFTLATPDKFQIWSGYYKPVSVSDQEYQNYLEELLKEEYDIIVLGKVRWNVFPQKFRDIILNKVNEGAILLAYFGDWYGSKLGEDIKSEDLKKVTENKISFDRKFLYPFKGLPQFKNYKDFENFINSTLEVYSYGNGKILLLKGYSVPHFQNLTPGSVKSPIETKYVEYDYLLSYIIQLMISYVKKPKIEISGSDYINTDINSFSDIEFVLKSDEQRKVRCEFLLRNDDNEIIFGEKKDLNLKKGENKVKFEIKSKIPKGNYFADIWVKENEKIINFGSSFIEVNSNDYIGDVSINTSFKKEEEITGEVNVISKEGRDNLKLKISLVDNFGRLQNEVVYDFKGEKINEKKISFKISPPKFYFSILQWLKFELYSDNNLVDKNTKFFSISNLRPKDDFRAILWFPYYNISYAERWYCRNIYESGFDSRYYTGIGLAAILENLWYVSNPTRFVDLKTDPWGTMDRKPEDHIRQPCLNDPEYLSKVEKELKSKVEKELNFSTFEFSLGDECHFASWRPPYDRYELCWCDRCVSKFHEYLEDKYGNIKNLNQNWKTDYKSFEEIKPVTYKEAIENTKLRPLWINYRIFMEDTWTGIFAYSRETIQSIVPDAKTGYEGSQRGHTFTNSFTAEDYYKLSQVMDLNNPYSHPFIRYAFKDFSKENSLLGLGWQGSYGPGIKNRKIQPWQILLFGANSIWIWHGPPREQSVVSPDLSFYEYFKPYVEQIPEIKRGIGKLFINCKREDDGIGILYSNTSVHASTLTPQLPWICENLNFFVRYFETSGYQFRIISYKQLEDGILNKEKFRILILPYTQSISKKQAQEIISFVNNGGIVIADIRPGVCDENGIFYKNVGILDDIFGVRQKTENFEVKKFENFDIKYSELVCNLPVIYLDSSISLNNGIAKESVENIPIFIVNNYGKGKGILLNLGFINYPGENMPGIRNVLNKVFEEVVGIEKEIKYEPDNIEIGFTPYRYKLGSHRYLGIISAWREGEEKECKLILPKKFYIYDIRQGKYLGISDTLNLKVGPEEAKIIGFLPYKINDLKINSIKKIKKGEILHYEIELQTEPTSPETHIFNVNVISPEGKEIKHYMENLKGEKGKVKGDIYFALNEKEGKYILRVKEVVSGISKDFVFEIE